MAEGTNPLPGSKESCQCEVCQSMCHRPCWPTPQEAIALINAGYGDRLMSDYWARHDQPDIVLLSPALAGYEGDCAPFWIGSSRYCTFFKDGKCELHEQGLKPLEGREGWHGTNPKEGTVPIRKQISEMWDRPAAQYIVLDWERKHI